MDYLSALILGIVQGLTEFLPVSSSGHLVLGQALLGAGDPGKAFEVAVHVGTLLSVLVYFRERVWALMKSPFVADQKEDRLTIGYLILGTIPAVAAYLLLKPQFDQAYASPVFTCCMLIVTGGILFIPLAVKNKDRDLNWRTAAIMGAAQAFAILPGISRSGSTITAGMTAGVHPTKAAEFSFLLAMPAILGGVVTEREAFQELFSSGSFGPYLAGLIAAFFVGLVAVYIVMNTIRGGRFHWFAYYCICVGVLGLIYFGLF